MLNNFFEAPIAKHIVLVGGPQSALTYELRTHLAQPSHMNYILIWLSPRIWIMYSFGSAHNHSYNRVGSIATKKSQTLPVHHRPYHNWSPSSPPSTSNNHLIPSFWIGDSSHTTPTKKYRVGRSKRKLYGFLQSLLKLSSSLLFLLP